MIELIPWQEFEWNPFPHSLTPGWELITDTDQIQMRDNLRRVFHGVGDGYPNGYVAGMDGSTLYLWCLGGIPEDPELQIVDRSQYLTNYYQDVYRLPGS